jgi:hypothetical protein
MEARLVKVEVAVDTLKEQLVRLEAAIADLGRKIDDNIASVRAEIDDVRKELHSTTKWLVGLILAHMLANISMLAALYAKVSGAF